MNEFIAEVWSRVNKIEQRALAAGLEQELSITEINILEKIAESPIKRMSDIARAVGVTLATMTVACDKLENKELLTRTRDEKDKRVVKVKLTAKGLAAYEFHRRFRQQMMCAMLDDLTAEEQRVLAGSLKKLERFFSDYDHG